MDIVIQTTAPDPVYEQIVRQIHEAVKSGQLKPGTPLPTVRQLARDLVINRNTVARAYRILEDQGVVLTAGRKGTFIRQEARREVAKVQTSHAERVMRRAVKMLRGEGLTRKEIADLFSTALDTEGKRG
jgi:GntR family transcriptional regulator